jgi:hypothetical protein
VLEICWESERQMLFVFRKLNWSTCRVVLRVVSGAANMLIGVV